MHTTLVLPVLSFLQYAYGTCTFSSFQKKKCLYTCTLDIFIYQTPRVHTTHYILHTEGNHLKERAILERLASSTLSSMMMSSSFASASLSTSPPLAEELDPPSSNGVKGFTNAPWSTCPSPARQKAGLH